MKGNSIGANQILSEQQITTQNKVDDQIGNAQGIKQLTGGEPLNGAGQSLAQRRNSNVADQPVSKSEQQLSASELASVKAKILSLQEVKKLQQATATTCKTLLKKTTPDSFKFSLLPETCKAIPVHISPFQESLYPIAEEILNEILGAKGLPPLPNNWRIWVQQGSDANIAKPIVKNNMEKKIWDRDTILKFTKNVKQIIKNSIPEMQQKANELGVKLYSPSRAIEAAILKNLPLKFQIDLYKDKMKDIFDSYNQEHEESNLNAVKFVQAEIHQMQNSQDILPVSQNHSSDLANDPLVRLCIKKGLLTQDQLKQFIADGNGITQLQKWIIDLPFESDSEVSSFGDINYNQLDSSDAYKRIMNDFVPVFLEYCDEQTRLTPEKCIMYFIKMFYSETQNHYNPLFDASTIIQETFMTKILPNLPENLKDPLLKQNNSELDHLIKKLNLNQELVYCQSIFYHLFIKDPQNPSRKELNRCIEATIQVGRKSANSFSQEHIMERIDHYITDDLGIKEDIKRAFLNKNKL